MKGRKICISCSPGRVQGWELSDALGLLVLDAPAVSGNALVLFATLVACPGEIFCRQTRLSC